jgi:hypothetical protein
VDACDCHRISLTRADAATFQTEAEFEQMFDMTAYNRLRKTCELERGGGGRKRVVGIDVRTDRAEEAFPTVYDKVRIRRE